MFIIAATLSQNRIKVTQFTKLQCFTFNYSDTKCELLLEKLIQNKLHFTSSTFKLPRSVTKNIFLTQVTVVLLHQYKSVNFCLQNVS